MKIDLDKMSEQELRKLNHDIVSRLHFLASVRRSAVLANFKIGDRVSFEAEHGTVIGTVIRINQKTASIDADDGRGWRVSPGALRKLSQNKAEPQANLFQLVSNKT